MSIVPDPDDSLALDSFRCFEIMRIWTGPCPMIIAIRGGALILRTAPMTAPAIERPNRRTLVTRKRT